MCPFIFKIPPPPPYSEIQKLLASDGLSGDYFGVSVAFSVNNIIVGAYNADPGGLVAAGSAYIFSK